MTTAPYRRIEGTISVADETCRDSAYRPRRYLPLLLCALLCGCAEPTLDCQTAEVRGVVASLVRDRLLRVMRDNAAPVADTRSNTRIKRLTRVSAHDARMIEWDKSYGQLACIARVVIEAPAAVGRTTVRTEAELRYRVTGVQRREFIVEVAFSDLMTLVAARTEPLQQRLQ